MQGLVLSMPGVANEHRIALEELYTRVGSGPYGLSNAEAQRRLAQYGPNELRTNERKSEIIKYLRQYLNVFAILLLVGAALAYLTEILDPGEGNLFIAFALFGVVVLNATFQYVQERETERIMESFGKMLPTMITVLRDGEERDIDAKLVVPGDIIVLSEGDKVPADGRLIAQNQLRVDNSSLTGESEPQLRTVECTHEDILESRNVVFGGTLVQSGDGRALVYATGMHSQFGHIVHLTKQTRSVETPIHHEIVNFTRVISVIAIVMGVFFFIVSLVLRRGVLGSLIFGIGIIVANVPEGMPAEVTLSLALASRRMARKQALIRNLESVETLGSATVICTDKTGTITQNKMSVTTVYLDGKEYPGDSRDLRSQKDLAVAWSIMALCNNARLTKEGGFEGDPTEGALITFAHELKPVDELLKSVPRVHEIPFDSATKRMITMNKVSAEQEYHAYLKGAPEVVFDSCTNVLHHGNVVRFSSVERKHLEEACHRLASRGERVLGLAYKSTAVEEEQRPEFILVGLVGMLDPPRPEVRDAIIKCRSAWIKVIMITGDYGLTAEAAARQVGLIEGAGRVVHGDELELMSDEKLADVLGEPELVFARTSPIQKLRIVEALQARGEIVTVTGDGVNDAPALKHADMGVAMGQTGTEVAKEAADMVLLDDNFATIVNAVEEGRAVYENMKKFITYILTSNVPEIVPFIAYVLLAIPLPLTVILMLVIDLGTDMLPAIGLGAEPPEHDVMRQPPRRRTQKLLTKRMLVMSYCVAGMVEAAAGFFAFFWVLAHGGWRWGEQLASKIPLYREAVTAFFVAVVVCQIANVLVSRTRRESLLTAGIFTNRLIVLGILIEIGIAGLFCYVPLVQKIMGTAPLSALELVLGVPFAAVILFSEERRKRRARRSCETPLPECFAW